MALSLIIIFLALYHFMSVYSGQQNTYGRQGIKYKPLPISSTLLTEEMVGDISLANDTTRHLRPACLTEGCSCCLALQSTQHFGCDPAKHFCVSHVLLSLTCRELFIHVRTNLRFIFCWVRIKAPIIFLDACFVTRIG